MAASSLSNLLSSLLPSKPPPPNLTLPPRVPLPKTPSGLDPLVATWAPPTSSSMVVWPSVANSNILFFKSGYNVQAIVQDNEPEEKLVGRFRREVLRAGVLQECKRRRFFENSRDKRKRKTREAARKNRKRRYPQWKDPKQADQEASKRKNDSDEEDNWDYEVELPYQ